MPQNKAVVRRDRQSATTAHERSHVEDARTRGVHARLYYVPRSDDAGNGIVAVIRFSARHAAPKHEALTAATDSAERLRGHRVAARFSNGGGACSRCGKIFQASAAARVVRVCTMGIQAPQDGSSKGEGCSGRDETTADTVGAENPDDRRNDGAVRENDPGWDATTATAIDRACSSTNTPFSPKSEWREERIGEKE